MIAVIFEVLPAPGGTERYVGIAESLRPALAAMDGFISVERFQSLSEPGKYLSLSFWRDEDAVRAWRTHGAHRAGQQAGRDGVFADYRIRVASVVRDYGQRARLQTPADSRASLD